MASAWLQSGRDPPQKAAKLLSKPPPSWEVQGSEPCSRQGRDALSPQRGKQNEICLLLGAFILFLH